MGGIYFFLSTILTSGQIVIGTSKAWFCGQDGSVYELTGQGGGSWFPQYGKNFTYTGEYVIVPEGDSGDWKVKFLTSGTFTATDALLIDVFAVGGGSGGGTGSSSSATSTSNGGGGGGGGYTITQKSVYLEKDKSYSIVIGDGGTYATNGNVKAGNGGDTSGFNVTASGGKGAIYPQGGSGGSGGGGANAPTSMGSDGAVGGSDGSNGSGDSFAGSGQGTTTREFGESTGDLYSGGGGGGASNWRYFSGAPGGEGGGANGSAITKGQQTAGEDALANTGGGGGGGGYYQCNGGNGGSGILIIRNHRE